MHAADWLNALAPHAARLHQQRLMDLVAQESGRFAATTLRAGPLLACFARQRIDAEAWSALFATARQRAVPAAITALFDGAPVNVSEARPALHTALRSSLGTTPLAQQAHAQARAAQRSMAALIDTLRDEHITDLVHVGIGGSDLGPRLVLDALRDTHPQRVRVHFLSASDGYAISRLLARLPAQHTAAVLVSKSFGTRETLLNGAILRDWLGGSERLLAVTANFSRAAAFGIAPDRILPLWDWVGGRYSLWSAVGFSVAAALGIEVFERLLDGAAQMDAHVHASEPEHNLAVRHALVAVWNRNAMGYNSQAVLPYDDRLSRLPAWLQQLTMESLGKSVTQDGLAVPCSTAPAVWGSAGADAQHSFFQALHQGTDTVPLEFIGVRQVEHPYANLHRVQLANMLAQAEALANGAPADNPQAVYPGNRPSSVLLLDTLTPESLGALLALYEHSVFIQATLWGINPFDQWGVELGKRIALGLEPSFDAPGPAADDPVTRDLIAELQRPDGTPP